MTTSSQNLSPRLMGGEILARVARERLTGRLTWEDGERRRQIIFSDGRPEQVDDLDHQTQVKAQVVAAVRMLAVSVSGKVSFDPVAAHAPASLGIDTLGETLVALLRTLRTDDLEAVWQTRAGSTVEPAVSFDKLAAAVARLGATSLLRPSEPKPLGALPRSPAERAAWIALLVLGGLTATSAPAVHQPSMPAAPRSVAPPEAPVPLPLPDDPEAQRLVEELNRVYADLARQSYYDVLGVDAKASADDVRNAYFEVAKRWHSDRLRAANLGDEAVRRAEEIFRYAGEAQKVLTDAEQRKSYDFVLDRKAQGLPTDVAVILEAEGAFRKAQTLVRRGQAAAAEPILRRVVEKNPGEAEFWAFLGFAVYSARGKAGLDEARKAIQKAIDMNGRLDAAHEFLGKIARIEGQTKDALRHFKKALELNPKNVDAARELRLINMRGPKEKDSGEGGLFGGLFKK